MHKLNDSSQAPRGEKVYYKCGICNIQLHSQPDENIGCKCGNIFIDVDYHKLVVKDFDNFQTVTID